MAEHESNRSSWDELARDLGLPPAEPERQRPAPEVRRERRAEPPPPQPKEPVDDSLSFQEEPAEAPVEAREIEAVTEVEERVEEEPIQERPRRRRNYDNVEDALRNVLDSVEGEGKKTEQPAGQPERRGRGGRGRPRRGRSAEEASSEPRATEPRHRPDPEPAAEAIEPEAQSRPEGDAPPQEREEPRRRRRRGRGKKEAHAAAEPVSGNGEEPRREPDDEMDEKADFSNWTLPNWQEVVAGLFRPDR